jgi:hypothetical protein
MGHAVNYIPPAATNSDQLVWGHLVGLYGIQKDIGQDFNGEPIVNGAAGRVDVMLEPRTPVDTCE